MAQGPTWLELIAANLLQWGIHSARPSANTVPDGAYWYSTNTAALYQSRAGSWAILTPQPPGAALLRHEQTILTDAQIKNLPTTDITVLPAQGAAIHVVPITLSLRTSGTNANPYTNLAATARLEFRVAAGVLEYLARNSPTAGEASLTDVLAGASDDALLVASTIRQTWVDSSWRVMPTNNPSTLTTNTPLFLRLNNAGAGDLTGGDPANTITVDLWYTQL